MSQRSHSLHQRLATIWANNRMLMMDGPERQQPQGDWHPLYMAQPRVYVSCSIYCTRVPVAAGIPHDLLVYASVYRVAFPVVCVCLI